jgi:tetratricopeptide (TPR) repeat protein
MSDDTGFNTAYHFDENLRDVPADRAGMEGAARHLETLLSSSDTQPRERLRDLGRLGVYLRILGNLDAAQESLKDAIALANELGDEKAALANRIRLGHVYQWQRRFAEADTVFAAVVEQCEQDMRFREYLDFAYQHYGKSKFDQGLYTEAEAFFRQALDIRQARGDEELIASSRLAWERASDEGRV